MMDTYTQGRPNRRLCPATRRLLVRNRVILAGSVIDICYFCFSRSLAVHMLGIGKPVAATSLRVLTPALAPSLKHGTSCRVHASRVVKVFARIGLGAAAAVDHLLVIPSCVLACRHHVSGLPAVTAMRTQSLRSRRHPLRRSLTPLAPPTKDRKRKGLQGIARPASSATKPVV